MPRLSEHSCSIYFIQPSFVAKRANAFIKLVLFMHGTHAPRLLIEGYINVVWIMKQTKIFLEVLFPLLINSRRIPGNRAIGLFVVKGAPSRGGWPCS